MTVVMTLLDLPTRSEQTTSGCSTGMLGAAFSRHIRIVNMKLVNETLSLWVLGPAVALVFAYFLTLAL